MPKKITQAEFITRALAVHGDKYDYSQLVYTGSAAMVTIICPTHGAFEQLAPSHTKGYGCFKCAHELRGARSRNTTQSFIEKAQAVHGVNTYDYSQAVYGSGNTEKVTIICPTHGAFKQGANKHMAGNGCPKCGVSKMSTSSQDGLRLFIQKATAVHGSRYNYSETIYLPNPQRLTIQCPAHGAFLVAAGQHLYGSGCPKCGSVAQGQQRRRRKDVEVPRFLQVHGDAYDYSKLPDIFPSREKLPIVCPVHGVFMQAHYSHLTGRGCPQCADETKGLSRRRTNEEFIAEAQAVHGNKYDYSQTVYELGQQKVAIICPSHGLFMQEPASHINGGSGCPHCAKEQARQGWVNRARGRSAVLYFLRFFDAQEEFYKVGITLYSVRQRYASKRDLAGYQFEVLATHTSSNAAAVYDWEQSIITTFAHLAHRPSRPFNGATECFSSADEILALWPTAG